MKPMKIIPVILAGGRGTRLWPSSREELPKQFCKIENENSLYQRCCELVKDHAMFGEPIVVTGAQYGQIAKDQIEAVGCEARIIIQEPVGRDTTAAIALAALTDDVALDDILLVLPSDHVFGDRAAFYEAVKVAKRAAIANELLVTFGVRPTHAETGYGYIRATASATSDGDMPEAFAIERFIEKPSRERARELIRDDKILWNAGLFLFQKGALEGELLRHAPVIHTRVCTALSSGTVSGNLIAPCPDVFGSIESISFDYSIMEKTTKATVVPLDAKWSDVGSWDAVWQMMRKDESGNVIEGPVYAEDTENNIIKSDGPIVGVVGLSNVAIVASGDAVLVTSRENGQNVKNLVERMKTDGRDVVKKHSGEARPWGRFDSLDRGAAHQVKRIRVSPGGQLSLQYHHHRAEHWVVIAGTATVTVDGNVTEVPAGEQVYIPKGAVHRLENFTDCPVEIIEVQIGTYFGEDDIVRVEDVYNREAEPMCAYEADKLDQAA